MVQSDHGAAYKLHSMVNFASERPVPRTPLASWQEFRVCDVTTQSPSRSCPLRLPRGCLQRSKFGLVPCGSVGFMRHACQYGCTQRTRTGCTSIRDMVYIDMGCGHRSTMSCDKILRHLLVRNRGPCATKRKKPQENGVQQPTEVQKPRVAPFAFPQWTLTCLHSLLKPCNTSTIRSIHRT
jgi:hypothetical protein